MGAGRRRLYAKADGRLTPPRVIKLVGHHYLRAENITSPLLDDVITPPDATNTSIRFLKAHGDRCATNIDCHAWATVYRHTPVHFRVSLLKPELCYHDCRPFTPRSSQTVCADAERDNGQLSSAINAGQTRHLF